MEIDGIQYDFINELYHSHSDRYVVSIHKNGSYIRIPRANRVWIMYNKKEIPKGYVVHHIDRDKHNDVIENLLLVSRSEHNKIHASDTNHYMFRTGHSYWNKPKSDTHKKKIKEAHIHRAKQEAQRVYNILYPAIVNCPEISIKECMRLAGKQSHKFISRLFKISFTSFKKDLLWNESKNVLDQIEENTGDKHVKSSLV